jgi:hypothetical protein
MAKKPDFEIKAAHAYFSAYCFNRAWDLIEKTDRTAEEDRMMFALNQASIFHWQQRPDCGDKQLAIGYWQASRIQALLGNALEAKRYAEVCLGYSEALEPFHLGYAYEALCRAAIIAAKKAAAQRFLKRAEDLAAQVKDKHDREYLGGDLATLKKSIVAQQ